MLSPSAPAKLQLTQPTGEPENILDWQKLVALGVSTHEAQAIARQLQAQQLTMVYWQRLMRLGMPGEVARTVGRAIANFDSLHQLPTLAQRALLHQHCPTICRAQLWRSQLFLELSD